MLRPRRKRPLGRNAGLWRRWKRWLRWELWLRRKQKRRLWRKLRKQLGIWLETRNLLLPGTAGAERSSGMPGS